MAVRPAASARSVRSTPSRPAIASRCTTALVEPPIAARATIAFWNDADGSKYRAAYFEQFDGVWRHGDWAEITEHDGLVIYGRSDATLNPGVVRIGTAEIYRQEGCDGLIAVGGGSPIDLAKAVALRVTHEGPLAQYAVIEGGLAKITSAVAPVIATCMSFALPVRPTSAVWSSEGWLTHWFRRRWH